MCYSLLGHSPTKDYPVNSNLKHSSPHNKEKTEGSSFPLGLKEQITHKKKFLEEHVPPHSKILLIGHSIGAYVVLNLLKTCHRASDVTKAILLFPTIERMAVSPSGRYVTPMVTYFKWLAVGSAAVFSILPKFVQQFLVQWWLSDRKNLMLSSVETVLRFLTPQSINGCFTMTQDEMKEVVHPDYEV